MASTSEPIDAKAITALTFDGSFSSLESLSELYVLQEAAARWAFDTGKDMDGDEVRPSEMFDTIAGTGIGGFYTILFARLNFTIGQAIQTHCILEERLFTSEAWSLKDQERCIKILDHSLDEITRALEISLDSPFKENKPRINAVCCVVNSMSVGTCRLLRNYRSRGSPSPACSIRQVIHATLSNRDHIPAIKIQEEYFHSALDEFANPTQVLMKELGNAFPKGTMVACVVSIGARHIGPSFQVRNMNLESSDILFQSSELVANEFASQCQELGPFFFRLVVASPFLRASALDETYSRVRGGTMVYLDSHEAITKLDGLVEALTTRIGVVPVERLGKPSGFCSSSDSRCPGSLAGKDGQSQLLARIQLVQQHLDNSVFRDINSWLKPIHQTSKLDANIRGRGDSTCQWILGDPIFMRWLDAEYGLFWYHGLMGTGKTVTISFITEILLARDDIYVAYYYFEFTNPSTLSEEALYRSLVAQLAPSAPSVMRDLHNKHHHGSCEPQLSTLQATLINLASTSSKPIFIIIDALDEFPPGQRKYLLQSLLEFCHSTGARRTHVVITSREDRDIRAAFDGQVDFQLDVQGDLVRQDIAAFVDQHLAMKKWARWPQDDVKTMRRVLNKNADGQFRMVACQVDILMQVKSSGQLQQSLRSLPRTLASTYEYILNQIPKDLRSASRSLLAFLAFAHVNISMDELCALVAVDFGDENDSSQLPLFQEANHFRDPLDLHALGTSLIVEVKYWKEGTSVQLAHASVKEYLLVDSGAWFALQEPSAHSLIAGACLAVLAHFKVLVRENYASPFWYSENMWYAHVLPNCSPALLGQQQMLYTTFPWTSRYLAQNIYHKKCPLSSVASLGLVDFLESCLLAAVWDTNALGSALIKAAGFGSSKINTRSIQCCRLLVSHGAKVDYLGEERANALQAASSAGNLDVAQFLIEEGANVNAPGGEYGTSLHAAADAATLSRLDMVQFLVQNGADLNAVKGAYGTALQTAMMHGSLELVKFLVHAGADVNKVGGEKGSAWYAGYADAWSESLEIVQFLVWHSGVDVNALGGEHGTPLQAAAQRDRLDIVQFLVHNGADVNAAGGLGGTALQVAAMGASLEVVEFLVQAGANVNVVGEERGTPLQIAASAGRLDIVQFLVHNGAKVSVLEGEDGITLRAAARGGSLEVVKFVVQAGADVSAARGTLHEAAQRENAQSLEIVQFLLGEGADVNEVGGLYGTALQAAALTGSLDIVQLLVRHGADVTATGGYFGTALQAATLVGSLNVVQFLVQQGADVTTTGGQFGTALQAAAHWGKQEAIQFHWQTIMDVNVAGGEHGTALQAAEKRRWIHLEIMEFLVQMGADVNVLETQEADLEPVTWEWYKKRA
ncbi:ankyrin repeat-containing domain protein [Flagelloscypha sp. PMI_526]|nr:ankyrin repeat-containing domain protein [Flagelloscypha sp. PMI_526]